MHRLHLSSTEELVTISGGKERRGEGRGGGSDAVDAEKISRKHV